MEPIGDGRSKYLSDGLVGLLDQVRTSYPSLLAPLLIVIEADHFLSWPFQNGWTWTAQVYFTLHTLTLLMKMHSYAFYNGHLSDAQRRLLDLDHPATASTTSAYKYPSSGSQIRAEGKEKLQEEGNGNSSPLSSLRDDLALELTSPLGRVTYPRNLTVRNYIDFLLCPTLCYELEYPRTDRFRWTEVFLKALAVFGCIFLLTIISEEYILPVLLESATRLEMAGATSEAVLILAESISMLLFPFTIIFLLVFLVIFEYVLGAFAEITCMSLFSSFNTHFLFPPPTNFDTVCFLILTMIDHFENQPKKKGFADRYFYSDWWNSTDWLEFSREWNMPVHNFFRRHVYGASRAYMSRPAATIITFLISALAHELVMACITKKVRGYGFVAMMLQLPIIMVQRTKWVRGRKLFNVSDIIHL